MMAKFLGSIRDRFVEFTVERWVKDNRYADRITPYGEDSVPAAGDRVLLVKTEGEGRYAAVGMLAESKGAKEGEKIFFGRNAGGEEKCRISMLEDGTVKAVVVTDAVVVTLFPGGLIDITGKGDYSAAIKGKFYLGNDSENLGKLFGELADLLREMRSMGPPPQHTAHPDWVQKIDAWEAKAAQLCLEG